LPALEDLKPGALVVGVDGDGPVTVVSTRFHGADVVTLTYRTAEGQVAERLLMREDEASLSITTGERTFTFDADGAEFRLAAEARRIRLAHLYDPMLAVHLSRLEPLPHQIEAVYGHLLPRQPLRFLLADDPGAGKTIMAGLYIKELMLRGDLARCLVVAPGGLVTQWQDELAERFGLDFEIVSRDMVEGSRTGNPFAERNLLIARLDHLARNDDLQDRLADTDWDLVVVDEAHRMSAHYYGAEVKETKRFRLGRRLGHIARHLLLMTATPHAGKDEDFHLFMSLLDADRFEGKPSATVKSADSADLMRRMVKEKLLTFEGKPLFPERRAYTVPYPLSPDEARLYEQVTGYVTHEMNRVDRMRATGEGRRGNRVGFALTILQRRLASSPAAIHRSLMRRRERLEAEREEAGTTSHGGVLEPSPSESRLEQQLDADDDSFDDSYDDLDDAEREALDDELVGGASTARSVAELDVEITALLRLEALAKRILDDGNDRKWAELSALLDDHPLMRHPDGSRRKIIVFTEHRDTLDYLVRRLTTRLGRADAVVAIHGGTPREERRRIQETFTQDRDCVVLVATDAAGEGINLQRAHLLVNYDLPWNPNRIEQRFGRVHRIGQTEVCHLWNLVAAETREGQVYTRLLDKLEEQRSALGGQVFDVLGEALPSRNLRELLMEAIRYGDRPDVKARLDEVIDASVGVGMAELVREHALATDVLTVDDVEAIRRRMQEAAAKRLQPHHVAAFFTAAVEALGGRVTSRERDRWEVHYVPGAVRAAGQHKATRLPVLRRYERVCFDNGDVTVPGRPVAEMVAPGHPLLDGLISVVDERYGATLRRGAVLVDDDDPGDDPRLVVSVEHAIVDGRHGPDGRPTVVSRRVQHVSIGPDGDTRDAGAAPYLDCRPATDDEQPMVSGMRDAAWLAGDIEARVIEAAVSDIVPVHVAEVRARVHVTVGKVRAAVQQRLTQQIAHWDGRAARLREQAAAGRQPRMNPDRAEQRADDLQTRRQVRMAELDRQQRVQPLPPVVTGGMLIVPAGLLARLQGEDPGRVADHARETGEVDRRAVAAVLAAERRLGREPTEMPHHNPGYDIRSLTADGRLLFVEVKGRIAGAETVSVSRQQVLHGLTAPDDFVLALVSVSPDGPDHDVIRYARRPFEGMGIGFAQCRAVFDWAPLWASGHAPS